MCFRGLALKFFSKAPDKSKAAFSKKNEAPAKLRWIDEFIENVRPYIAVRLEDHLLIKRPNQATKINESGAMILHALLKGESISGLWAKVGSSGGEAQKRENEILQFMMAVKSYLEGNLDIFSGNPSVEKAPFEMKFSEYPVLSEIALTYECNLKCKFCYAGCNCSANPAGSEEILSLAGFQRVIDSLVNEAKIPSVSFTGGEPTLSEHLFELIAYAKSYEMRVNLISNGVLIDEPFAKKLKQAGLDSAQISIEGTNARSHDTLVSQKGAFEKSVQAIRFLQEQGIHVHTNSTITAQNLDDLYEMPRFIAEELGLKKFSMNMIIPTGSADFYKGLHIPYVKMGEIIEKINARSKEHGVEFMWYSPIPMCMFNTITAGLGNKGCSACDGLASVAPNGDLLPCASYDDPVGNIEKSGFRAVWSSPEATFYRDKKAAPEGCRVCENFHICNGACPLYWRVNGHEEIEGYFALEGLSQRGA